MTQKELEINAPGAVAIYTSGAGGKGGGDTPQEATNTLRAAAIVRVVEAIGEGPIEGIAGGASGVYINDTTFANENGTPNFGSTASFDYKVGLPDQDYLRGFSAVESEIGVNTPVTNVANNIVRTTSGAATLDTNTGKYVGGIDAVFVTMQLPNGLSKQDKENGDLNGTSVTFKIDTRPEGGTYSTVGTYTIEGKTMAVYEAQYRVMKPANATPTQRFDIRVTRISPETGAEEKNAITWARMTEIQEVKISYPDAAVVGIAIDAQSVGNAIPKRGYLVKGLLTRIPVNLNPDTREYSGLWNGQFKNTTKAFDNPVWCLADLMTSDRYGAGISDSDIDWGSFYNASVYCDENVEYKNSLGEVVSLPRFTFSTRIANRPEILTVCRNIAGAMNANLIYWNGKWTIVQDRPDNPTGKIITKANIIGNFEYSSSGVFERHTAVNVTYNDRYDKYLQRVITREATIANGFDKNYTDSELYGYNPIDIIAYGCTTEGQAIRAAMYTLITEIEQNEGVSFELGMNGLDVMPGDIFDLFDEDRANISGAGRIVSITGTTVVLDRPVTLSPASTIQVLLQDGHTIESRSITQTSGNLSTITIASAFSQAPMEQADFYIASAISAKQFKVVNITCPEEGRVRVEAIVYDANKFLRVEDPDMILPKKQFSSNINTQVNPPDTITFAVESTILPNGVADRRLRATWNPPANTTIAGYDVDWTREYSNKETIKTETNVVFIPANADGIYRLDVWSRNFDGKLSGLPASAQYAIGEQEVGSVLSPPSDIFVKDTTSKIFNSDDLVVEWYNPNGNANFPTATRDFKVSVYAGTTLLRESYVPGVVPGSKQYYTYSYADNVADGGPRRAVTIWVQVRDASSALTTSVVGTFTNPPPGIPVDISINPGIGSNQITFEQPSDADFAGVLVWGSSNQAFVNSEETLIYEGGSTFVAHNGLVGSAKYYYRLAAYDSFEKNYAGTGLNMSATFTATPISIDFDKNKIRNSSFEATKEDGHPTYFTAYNNGGGAVTFSQPGGRQGGKAYGLKAGAASTSTFGLGIATWETPDNFGVVGGYTQGVDYVISFYAKKMGGAGWSNMRLAWNNEPNTIVAQSNPALSALWQRYVFYVKWTTNPVEGNGRIYISVNGNTALNDEIIIDDLMVEVGEAVSPYQSRLEELVEIEASMIVGIIADEQMGAYNATKLTGTVDEARIAGLAASKITGQLTSAQIASLDAAKVAGVLDDSQLGQISAAKVAGALTDATIAATKISGQLASWQIASLDAVKVTGQLSDAQIAAIAASKMTGQINNTQIMDGSIDTPKLTANSVTTTQLAAGAVTAGKILAGTITGNEIAANTITSNNILANTILASDIAALTITGTEIAAGAISAAKIEAGAITAGKIAAGAVVAGNIAAGSIVAGDIAANAITGTKIAADTITSAHIVAGSILASDIAAETITAAQIAGGTITGAKIAAGSIQASNIAAGAITAGKLFVTGQGKALNADPSMSDATAWYTDMGSAAVQTDATSPVGSYSMRVTNGTQLKSNRFPVEAGKRYKVSLFAKQVSGGGALYIRLYSYNSSNAHIGGAGADYIVTALTPAIGNFEGVGVPAGWTRYSGYIDAPVGAKNADIYLHINWNTTGVTDIADARAEEYIGADLIVDGSITASKLAAGVIEANAISANSITSYHIAAGSIITEDFAAESITTPKLAAGAVTTEKITAGAITAEKIAAGAITANNIDSRGLTIKDANGTVIFSSGQTVPLGYMPSGVLNSEVTAGSIGAISTNLSNAPASILNSNVTAGSIGAIGAGNPITTGNATTYISSAAIGGTLIANGAITAAKISVGSLESVSAVIGTLRTSTSGQRTEIRDNVIKMYDASNVLRIQMGDLTL